MLLSEMKDMPKIGQWWTECCELDLQEIKSQADIDEIMESAKDSNIGPEIWDTEIEALTELKTRYPPDEIDEEFWAELFRSAHDRRGPICTCRFQLDLKHPNTCLVHDRPWERLACY